MRALVDDLRYGLRQLRHAPAFAATAMITFAVGIASTVTVFSWIDGLLLHPFPGTRDEGRLAVLEGNDPTAPNGGIHISHLEYRHYRDSLQTLEGLVTQQELLFRVGDAATAHPVWGCLVSGNYFSVLGVETLRGRLFDAAEAADTPGAFPVAVISERLWRTQLQSDEQVVGRPLRVNGQTVTVIGVTAGGFRGTSPAIVHDLWIRDSQTVLLGAGSAETFTSAAGGSLYAIARLKPGVSVAQANHEAATAARRLAASLPPDQARGIDAVVRPLWRMRSGPPALMLEPLVVLMAMALLVLVVACANVANLLLARVAARTREIATRLALGASRVSLLRGLFVESLLVAAGGAIIGVPLASWLATALPALVPDVGVPVALDFELNTRIVVFVIGVCAAAAVLAASVPVVLQLRSAPQAALVDGSRGVSSARGGRLRASLVVVEVALAALSLAGAGLFVRSFDNARTIHPGFDVRNVLLSRVSATAPGLTGDDVVRFCRNVRRQLRGSAGIEDVAYADYAPLGSGGGPWTTVTVPGYVPAVGERMSINKAAVSPGYFGAMRIPLLEGREFTDADDADAEPVVIVTQAFARRYFADATPVGRTIEAWGRPHAVVGLARDAKYFSAAEAPLPFFYVPFDQRYRIGEGGVYLFTRAAGGDAAAAIRGVLGAEPDTSAAFSVFPLSEWTSVTLLPLKAGAALLAALGFASLLLAGVGLYGVMSYTVVQRTREIGIRIALGASPRMVKRAVVGRGLLLTGAGLLLGLAGALALGRVVSSLLVDVAPDDPLTLAGVAVFLIAVASLASYVPAARATRVDPAIALRCE